MAQAQLLYVGTERGVAILSNPGRSKRWLHVATELQGTPILALDCNPDEPRLLCASSTGGVLVSQDGGASWQPGDQAGPPLPQRQLELQGAPPAALRVDGRAVLRSEDGGQTWQPAAIEPAGTLTVLLGAAYHQDLVFAGSDAGEVWLSSDRGRSWERIGAELGAVSSLAAGRVL